MWAHTRIHYAENIECSNRALEYLQANSKQLVATEEQGKRPHWHIVYSPIVSIGTVRNNLRKIFKDCGSNGNKVISTASMKTTLPQLLAYITKDGKPFISTVPDDDSVWSEVNVLKEQFSDVKEKTKPKNVLTGILSTLTDDERKNPTSSWNYKHVVMKVVDYIRENDITRWNGPQLMDNIIIRGEQIPEHWLHQKFGNPDWITQGPRVFCNSGLSITGRSVSQ